MDGRGDKAFKPEAENFEDQLRVVKHREANFQPSLMPE